MTALEGHADDVDDEDQEKDEDYEYDVDDYNNEKRLSFSVLRGLLRSLQTISLDLQANAAAAPRFWCAKYKRKSLQIKTEECTMAVPSGEMLWGFFSADLN